MTTSLTLSVKQIMALYGLSESGARNKIARLKERFSKSKEQPITIQDVSEHLKIPVPELQKML